MLTPKNSKTNDSKRALSLIILQFFDSTVTAPVEAEVKKKRAPATGKKPTPAITATKTKPRKKK